MFCELSFSYRFQCNWLSFLNYRITLHDCTNVDTTDRNPPSPVLHVPCQHQLGMQIQKEKPLMISVLHHECIDNSVDDGMENHLEHQNMFHLWFIYVLIPLNTL